MALLVILVASMVLGAADAPAAEPVPTIRLGYSDVEAFPYQISHDANPPGIAMEIIRQACKDLGVNVVFVKLPNLRVQQDLKDGQRIDGAFMFSHKPDREENGVYPTRNGTLDDSRRLATLSFFLYKIKGNPLHWDGKRISGVDLSGDKPKIGANMGYSIVADLAKLGITVDDGARTTEQNFQKLQKGRLAGFAHQDLVADNYIRTQGITWVEKLPIPLATKPYFLMFSHQFVRANPALAEKIWTRIGQIRDSVTSAVVSKYQD